MDTKHDRSELLDALEDIVFALDVDGALVEWNAHLANLVGDDPEGTPFADLFADSEAVRAAVDDVRTSDAGATKVVTLATDPGRVFELRLSPAGDGAGAVVGSGRERDSSEPPVEPLLDRMTGGFFALDDEWRFTYLNERGREVISTLADGDYSVEELIGRDIWKLLPEAVGSPFYEKYHGAMETQEAVSFESRYDPTNMWFDVRAYPSESGLSVYFTDATQERRQREQLRERERVLRTIHDVIADADRTFAEQVDALMDVGRAVLNVDYATLSRIDGEEYVFEYVDSPTDELCPGDTVPLSATNCERAVLTERTLVLENIPEDAPDLAERTGNAEMGIACYLGAPVVVDGDVYGTFCFYDTAPREVDFSDWDVTVVDIMARWMGYELERRRVTDALRRQNERLDRFAGIVSHDLRNPLNVARGHLELGRDAAEELGDDALLSDLAAVERAHQRMERLIDDLLTMSREGTEVEEAERVSLSTAARSAWQTVATDEATISVVDDAEFDADPHRLRQLFENLFRNCVEHGGDGVAVEVGTLADGFYVEDDGPGIPESDRESVFEAGFSTNEKGTGFGLAIVAELAAAHGWSVAAVAPERLDGARFEARGVSSFASVT